MDLFAFRDYRDFLRAHVAEKKATPAGFSIRAWCRRTGAKSPATLNMILTGRRHPGEDLIQRLATYFGFGAREQQYFEAMVRLAKAGDDAVKQAPQLERLAKLAPRAAKDTLIDYDTFKLVASWAAFAVRELATLPDFKASPRWISTRLRGKIGVLEAREILNVLLRRGFLKKDDAGKIVRNTRFIEVAGGGANALVQRFHEGVVRLAAEALLEVPAAQREFTGVTFNLDPKRLPEIRTEVRRFVGELLERYENCSGPATYQVEIAVFPLSNNV